MLPPSQYRDYVLCRAFGWTLQEIDDQPAARTDWLLACHRTTEQVRADKQREAERG